MVLLDFGCAGDGGSQKRLDELYSDVQAWCSWNGQSLHMVRFTSELFGIASSADFPQAHPGWMQQVLKYVRFFMFQGQVFLWFFNCDNVTVQAVVQRSRYYNPDEIPGMEAGPGTGRLP